MQHHALASVNLEYSVQQGSTSARLMSARHGDTHTPLDCVLLRDAVLHAHARLLPPPPRHAVPLTIEHHVKVHACEARAGN